MARDIEFLGSDYNGSNPLYYIAYSAGDVSYVKGATTEAYNALHWTSYARTLTLDPDTNIYIASFPAVPNGTYVVEILERLGATPATTDTLLAEDELVWLNGSTPSTAPQTNLDSDGFFNTSEFAETLTYNEFEGESFSILAVVNRNLPNKIEDGHNLSDYIEIATPNNDRLPLIQPGRDTVLVAGRFGGAPRNHTVSTVLGSDSKVWNLRLR